MQPRSDPVFFLCTLPPLGQARGMNSTSQRVVVMGASRNPERYSNKAVRALREHGHEVLPVNPGGGEVEGLTVLKDLSEIEGKVDTLTLYVGPNVSATMTDSIVRLHPARVIFNPGAENPALRQALEKEGIACEEACTLVMLSTEQF
jgi:uncharacterized protein